MDIGEGDIMSAIFHMVKRAACGALCILFSMILIAGFMAADVSYADMGLPDEPEYTVVTGIYGTNYFKGYDHYDSRKVDGTLYGGQTFYVWDDSYDDVYMGSTDPSFEPGSTGDFIFIYKSETTSSSEYVSPEVGSETAETCYALSTEELNVMCGPGYGFERLEVLPEGTYLEYDRTYKTNTTWVYVTANGVSGWANGDYLRKTRKYEEEEEEPEASDIDTEDEYGESDNITYVEQKPDKNKSRMIKGIVLICIGCAILIAALAAYLLSKKKDAARKRGF